MRRPRGGVNEPRFAPPEGHHQIGDMVPSPRPLVPAAPVLVTHLFPALHQELVGLLRHLDDADWGRPTACRLWSVKDIAAHLLDTQLRRLSSQRDGRPLIPDQPASEYASLVAWLNRLNAEWITAARRLSPQVLIDLLEVAGPQVATLLQSLDPAAPAIFSVAWTGESQSPNWLDIGREYTEWWVHQQQIRDAVQAPGLYQRRLMHPVLAIFARALPPAYRSVVRNSGCAVHLEVVGDAGGDWTLVRADGSWQLWEGAGSDAASRISLDTDTAWRLFSKQLPPDQARVRIAGDRALGAVALGAVAVMA